jgi:hypothetical protein
LPDGSTGVQSDWITKQKLAFLDLRNPAKPGVSELALSLPGAGSGPVDSASLVADGKSSTGFYIAYRIRTGSSQDPESKETLYQYASFAQRWQRTNGAWQTEPAVNIPGALARTWAGGSGERLFLTRDDLYTSRKVDSYWQWFDTVTLKLLRQVETGGKLAAEVLDVRKFEDSSPRSMVYDGNRMYIVSGNSYAYYYGGYPTTGVAVDSAASGSGGTGGTADPATPTDTSDHLAIVDMSQGTLALAYDQPTGLSGLELMGTQQNRLFVNLQGDGILVVDVANAAAPKAQSFQRILGWPSGIEFVGGSAYLPAYNYGTYRIDLSAPGNL